MRPTPAAAPPARVGRVPLADAALDALRARVRPFEEAEVALVRAVLGAPAWLPEADEAALRYALNLARLGAVRTPAGADVDLAPLLAPFREHVLARLVAPLLRAGGPELGAVAGAALDLAVHARAWRRRVAEASPLSLAALDREVCEKALVLVCGGGGGVAWSYLGAFALLERYGLQPRLLAGSSMGAVLLLFRARRLRWEPEETLRATRGLRFGRLFRVLDRGARYGLPAALRLSLRAALGEHLAGPDGRPPTLEQLAIPLVVSVTGIRAGALPRDPAYYEHLLDLAGRAPRPSALARKVAAAVQAIGELVAQRDRLARIHLGAEPGTGAFDAVDAVGFSSALPGVIHYDVLRDDPRMHRVLGALLERRDVARLVDGGLVDVLPARAAWGLVQAGTLGTRNAFVLALEGFGPKLSRPLWYGLEQLAAQNVARNLPFVGHLRSFQRVLSPLELLPDDARLTRAIQDGTAELHPDMALVARLVRPFPPPDLAAG